jgi:hypothetical protein
MSSRRRRLRSVEGRLKEVMRGDPASRSSVADVNFISK